MLHIESTFKLNPWVDPIDMFKEKCLRKEIPLVDEWRIEEVVRPEVGHGCVW